MFAFQLVTVMLVALAMSLAVAHALEMPGKMRLDRDAYFIVQKIYYPGFTIGGGGEFAGLLATAILLWLTPPASNAFWLVLIALVCVAAMQAIYWAFIHPVNRVWLQGEKLGAAGASFFATGDKSPAGAAGAPPHWTELRKRWEYSHLARAVLASAALLALVAAIGMK